jgi:hypothetical protein
MLYRALLYLFAALGVLTVLLIAAVILHSSMRPHFLHIVSQGWDAMMKVSGTTTFGFILWTIAVGLVVWACGVMVKWRFANKPLKDALYQSIWPEGAMSLAGVSCLLLGVFAFFIMTAIYDDHKYLAVAVKTLERDNPQKDREIESLKTRLTETCYMPDRRLTRRQRDLLYDSLKKIATKYEHPHLVTGFFKGDMESTRFWISIYSLFKDSGWNIENDAVQKPQRVNASSPPDLGFGEGLSIQIQMDTDTPEKARQRQISIDITQAFSDAGLTISQYPVGKGNAIENEKDLILWVGIKKADWLESTIR